MTLDLREMPYKPDVREYLNWTCTNNYGFHVSYSDHNPCFTFDPDAMQKDRGVIPGTLKIKGSYITYLSTEVWKGRLPAIQVAHELGSFTSLSTR